MKPFAPAAVLKGSLMAACLFCATPALAQQKLTVLLDWFVNPDHAPLLVAHASLANSAGPFGYGLINAAAALNAPAVSDRFGLRLQDARGHTFQPALDTLGRFQAWLGDGTYRATAGEDLNGNGIYGESGERRDERSVTLSSAEPGVDLGDLQPR